MIASGPDHLGREGDRVAIAELFNRYMDALDRKDWDLLRDVFTEDASARVTFPFPGVPAQEFQGRDAIVGFASAMVGSPEIVTQHMTGNFSVAFDGDTAEASVRMRNHHAGVGPRAGLFQESIGAFGGTFVRTVRGLALLAVVRGHLGEPRRRRSALRVGDRRRRVARGAARPADRPARSAAEFDCDPDPSVARVGDAHSRGVVRAVQDVRPVPG